jgi:hypothetical protein
MHPTLTTIRSRFIAVWNIHVPHEKLRTFFGWEILSFGCLSGVGMALVGFHRFPDAVIFFSVACLVVGIQVLFRIFTIQKWWPWRTLYILTVFGGASLGAEYLIGVVNEAKNEYYDDLIARYAHIPEGLIREPIKPVVPALNSENVSRNNKPTTATAKVVRQKPQSKQQAYPIPAQASPELIKHPVIGLLRTSVTKDANSHRVTILVALQNTSSFETTAHVSLIGSWNDVPIPPINEPRDFAFAPQGWVEVSVPIYLSLQDEAAFLSGTGTLRARLTAEYPDREGKTTFILEGRIDPKFDTIDIMKSTWNQ